MPRTSKPHIDVNANAIADVDADVEDQIGNLHFSAETIGAGERSRDR